MDTKKKLEQCAKSLAMVRRSLSVLEAHRRILNSTGRASVVGIAFMSLGAAGQLLSDAIALQAGVISEEIAIELRQVAELRAQLEAEIS
jgi:hypothetical protein